MNYKDTVIKVIAEVCRVLLGVVFIFSGFVKAVDPMGSAIKVGDYITAFGMDFLSPLVTLISFNLSAIEFVLGVCMLLGVYRKFVTFLTLLFMVFMTPLTLYLAIFDPVSDCGCFGDAIVISNWETFFKNVVLLAASILTFIYNQRLLQAYTYKAYWFVALYSYLFIMGFSYRNYYHLPIIDFRPYKIGANIPELMAIPEGTPQDEYRYSFIYEKNGVRKEFTLDDYPADDPEWTFVDSKTELIQKGYEPPIEAFQIYNPEGEDVTDEILMNDEGILLLIAPRLEKAKDERIDEINNLYDYALEHQIEFYCITGSSVDAIEIWSDNTGAEYPFLIADETLLKTIIRSNPGLVLMHNGTILMKWHYKDIPEEEDIERVLTSYLQGREEEYRKQDVRLRTNLLIFTLPLLFVWFYDYLRNRRKTKK